jgi:Uma2 family endonuclease
VSVAPKPRRITVSQILALISNCAGRKAEVVDGIVRLQHPSSVAHGTTISNLTMTIGIHLRETLPQRRIVTDPGFESRVRATWNYRVPELGVTRQPNPADQHMMSEPLLLIEVLSPLNEDKTCSNVPLYDPLPSVQKIMILDLSRVSVQILRRGDDASWPVDSEEYCRGGLIRLGSIGLDQRVRQAYRGTWLA